MAGLTRSGWLSCHFDSLHLLTRFERKFDELSKLIQRLVAVQKNDESD
ncbi:hypothetical protein ACEQPO_06540 [Bacillus sp. SL00103]